MIKFLIFISCLIIPVVLYTFEIVPLTRNLTSAGNPFWDVETQNLYFVEFEGTLLFRYSWSRKTVDMLTIDGIDDPTSFVPINGSLDRYVVSSHGSVYIVNWDGSSDRGYIEEKLFTISPNVSLDSFLTTEAGEFFTGAISPNHCAGETNHGFYRYTRENGLEEIAKHYIGSTGIEIVGDTLYHLDGCHGDLTAFDIDPVTRALGTERTVYKLPPGYIFAELVADEDGFLYCVLAGKPTMLKFDPRIPAIVEEITTPTETQHLVFGGPDLKTVFVTPANLTPGTDLQRAPAGDLLLVGGFTTPGVPEPRANF